MSQGKAAELGVVVVTFNSMPGVLDCLGDLYKVAADDGIGVDVVVVDNASVDGTADAVGRAFPEASIVRNDTNRGFGRAVNQGARLVGGSMLLWLNPDVEIRPGSLRRMVASMRSVLRVGVVGPRVLHTDGSLQAQCKRGQPTLLRALGYWTGLGRLPLLGRVVGGYLADHVGDDDSAPVESVSGCCLLTTRDVWDALGGIDEDYFAFGEDLDYCLRAHSHGHRVIYEGRAVVTHHYGKGGSWSRPEVRIRAFHESMIVYLRKHSLWMRVPPMALLFTGAVKLRMWFMLSARGGLRQRLMGRVYRA